MGYLQINYVETNFCYKNSFSINHAILERLIDAVSCNACHNVICTNFDYIIRKTLLITAQPNSIKRLFRC